MKIEVSVIPNSRNIEIIKISESCYRVRIDAPPIKDKANKRLIKVLAEHFKVSESSISIIKGLKSKNKIIKIDL